MRRSSFSHFADLGPPHRSTCRSLIPLVAALTASLPASAHEARSESGLQAAWSSWSFDPWVTIMLVLAALVYCRGVRICWRRGFGMVIRPWQAGAYAAGFGLLASATVSPLHAVGAELFSVHMLQHLVLMLLAAPLLMLGSPLLAFAAALPRDARRRFFSFFKTPWLGAVLAAARRPALIWLLFATTLWISHAPRLFSAAVESELAHAAQHAGLFSAAILFWWTIFEFARRAEGQLAGVAFAFTTMLHGMALGAIIASADSVLYPVYEETAKAWGIAAPDDQRTGGYLMWMPPMMIYLLAVMMLLGVCLKKTEERARTRERSFAAPPLMLALLALAACGGEARPLKPVADGAPSEGRELAFRYGCGSCHVIPGVRDAEGTVGPPLESFAERKYIAGTLLNAPESLIDYLVNPQNFEPDTAMPNLGITEPQARHIAAFLYTLR